MSRRPLLDPEMERRSLILDVVVRGEFHAFGVRGCMSGSDRADEVGSGVEIVEAMRVSRVVRAPRGDQVISAHQIA